MRFKSYKRKKSNKQTKSLYRSRAGRHFYGTENEIWAGFVYRSTADTSLRDFYIMTLQTDINNLNVTLLAEDACCKITQDLNC